MVVLPVTPGTRLTRLLGAALCALSLLAAPAAADDDSDDSSSSSSSASAAAGTAPGGGDGRVRGGIDLGPNPGSGDILRDAGRALSALFGTVRPQPPAPPPPQPQRRPAQQAAEAEARELVAIGLPAAARAQALAEGFAVIAERGIVTRLRAPPRLSTAAARERLRALAPNAVIDLNHLYRPSADAAAPPWPRLQIGWPEAPACGDGLLVGLIDTRVDTRLAALAGRVETVPLRAPGRRASSAEHGTAIAALLVGDGTGGARGLLPGARLIAADPFHARPEGGDATDAFDLVSAIVLMAERGVPVVAMPLAGPANAALDAAGRALVAGGATAVAAAGNDGPRAPPRYPAAYPWAVAATAVDAQTRIYAQAVRGPHIAFAAPGVAIPVVVGPNRRPEPRTGTSFAVPFVAAALALSKAAGQADPLAALAARAADLGPPGRDPIFGWGLVRAASGC